MVSFLYDKNIDVYRHAQHENGAEVIDRFIPYFIAYLREFRR